MSTENTYYDIRKAHVIKMYLKKTVEIKGSYI